MSKVTGRALSAQITIPATQPSAGRLGQVSTRSSSPSEAGSNGSGEPSIRMALFSMFSSRAAEMLGRQSV